MLMLLFCCSAKKVLDDDNEITVVDAQTGTAPPATVPQEVVKTSIKTPRKHRRPDSEIIFNLSII